MEEKEITIKESVQFILKKIDDLGNNGDIKGKVRYEFREMTLTHIIEISTLNEATKPLIKMMYEFEDLFLPESILFVSSKDSKLLKPQKPIFEHEYNIIPIQTSHGARFSNSVNKLIRIKPQHKHYTLNGEDCIYNSNIKFPKYNLEFVPKYTTTYNSLCNITTSKSKEYSFAN